MLTTRRKFLKMVTCAGAAAGARLGVAPAFAQQRPIKMGTIVARSGVMATVGEGGLAGVQWGVDRINKAGGILGRKIELIIEEETSPKETAERFRKLALQDKVDVINGCVSTGSGLAVGPAAEELKMLWLSHDATTQKGVDETMPKPKYAFRSTDNECETVMASLLTVKHWRGKIKTVGGINLDYSYGRNNWEAFLTIMKKYNMDVTPIIDLWVPIGTIDLTSHVAALKQKKPDLIFATFLFAEVPVFFKQAQAAGLTEGTRFVLPAAGFQHTAMKKAFSPEGALVGHNSMYFEAPNASPLLKEFVKDYYEKYKDYPHFESDRAYATVAAYKAGVEQASKAIGGKWPTTDQIIQALEGLEVETLGGLFRYREDHIPDCNFYEGFTTAKNKHDFLTIDPVEVMHTSKLQKPPGVKFYDWIAGWK